MRSSVGADVVYIITYTRDTSLSILHALRGSLSLASVDACQRFVYMSWGRNHEQQPEAKHRISTSFNEQQQALYIRSSTLRAIVCIKCATDTQRRTSMFVRSC